MSPLLDCGLAFDQPKKCRRRLKTTDHSALDNSHFDMDVNINTFKLLIIRLSFGFVSDSVFSICQAQQKNT